LPAVTVESPQRLAHHVDRHDAGDDGMLFTQPGAERGKQILRGHVDLVAQVFCRLLEFREIIAVGLDQVADALDRIGLVPRTLVAVGHLGCDQRLAAPRFGICSVQPL
jgi:hypothetical protein